MVPKLRTTSFSALDVVARPATASAARAFTTTRCCEKMSKARFDMITWLKGRDGSKLAEPTGRPNYIGPHEDQPFPQNPLFRSQTILDDTTREIIWSKVMRRGESIKAVSAEIGVDVRRVAAIVRLKEVQRNWESQGKWLAKPYAKAVAKMLPKTSFSEHGNDNVPFESINDVHVHNLTMQQLFVPVSESRHFTREDAAKAFHEKMLSADKRSRQPELIDVERKIQNSKEGTREEGMEIWKVEMQEQEVKIAEKLAKQAEDEAKKTTKVRTDRFEFRFKEVAADDVGTDGRSRKGTGWRYGVPHEDRKRGQVKIPTSVP